MPGNSRRKGAIRKPGTKKGPTKGSGGKGRRALRGKGPTPKAVDRPYHPAAKRAVQRRPRPASRKPDGPEAIGGRNAVFEALAAGVPAVRLEVAASAESDSRLRDILRLAAESHLPIMEAHHVELDRRGPAKNQGVVLHVAPFAYVGLDALFAAADAVPHPPFIVALDSVTDPHNLGAVIRSAAAFGADGVAIPTRRAAGVTAAAWKASAGAAAKLPVARVTNLVRALERCKDEGCTVIGLDGKGSMLLAGAAGAADAVVIVVGSEGKGLTRLVRETCDITARIPMGSRIESLNASVAAGIACYEVAKAREA
ncbi:MAG: 23S rRNA (guanosine(2251)-2'-O)-methyltransferase RlmB [Bifidobacteriaceae bacterium]|jgi:23S rRNA (guanosine2251-2'-O)-methyltransferase|nr:23S rRNA (guanosine(2251)-2'-O)-methyltransferase RlmB [Bifidobacteriaceae bacterium]